MPKGWIGDRMRIRIAAIAGLAGFALLGGCQTMQPAAAPSPGVTVTMDQPAEWQRVASAQDQEKIGRLAAAWTEALEDARKGGFTR